jgi:A/G-specific adenine glycosylase
MLQQTQVSRVLDRYKHFLALFPTVDRLAAAPTAPVLAAWQGLGYNRRALALQNTARLIIKEHDGTLPSSYEALLALPGVGVATAGALSAFVYNEPVPFIETNIRAAFLHFFFLDEWDVPDAEILPLVAATLDEHDPRSWYYALMDYGAWIKKTETNPSRRSKHHTRQSPFEGSRRQLRAMVLRLFLADSPLCPEPVRKNDASAALSDTTQPSRSPDAAAGSHADLSRVFLTAEEITAALSGRELLEVRDVLQSLCREGFLREEAGHPEVCDARYSLA